MIKELLCERLKRLNQSPISGKWRSQFMELGHTANILLCKTAGSRTATSWPSDELSRAYLSECTPLKTIKALVSNFAQEVLALFRGVGRPRNSRESPRFGSTSEAFREFQNFSLLLFSCLEVG